MVSRQGWDQLYNDNVDDVLLACHYAHLKSLWITKKFSVYNDLLQLIPSSPMDTLLPVFIGFVTTLVGEASNLLAECLQSKPLEKVVDFIKTTINQINPLLKDLSRPCQIKTIKQIALLKSSDKYNY